MTTNPLQPDQPNITVPAEVAVNLVNPQTAAELGSIAFGYLPDAQAKMFAGDNLIVSPQDNVEAELAPMRLLEVNGKTYETDLPEGVQPFETNESGKLKYLVPSELDKLPVGIFTTLYQQEVFGDEFDEPRMEVAKRVIQIIETENGKAITVDSMGEPSDWSKVQEGAGRLMSALGYVVEADDRGVNRVTAIPTPETAQRSAKEQGVNLILFPDVDVISPQPYLSATKVGHPASTHGEVMWRHDISDDHITARALGKKPLDKALDEAADRGLSGEMEIGKTAARVDNYTATLRAIVAPHSEMLGEANGKEKGRQTLIKAGLVLGITEEESEAILAEAQKNAQAYGFDVQELA